MPRSNASAKPFALVCNAAIQMTFTADRRLKAGPFSDTLRVGMRGGGGGQTGRGRIPVPRGLAAPGAARRDIRRAGA